VILKIVNHFLLESYRMSEQINGDRFVLFAS